MAVIQIAVMGYGVVGTGVAEVLSQHEQHLARRAHEDIHIKYVLVRRDYPQPPPMGRFTKSFNEILNDPEIRVVVEVMGGLTPAYDYVRRCLLAGKSVVTSNKELVAEKGAELLQIARDQNANFLFEASVGGGIPIIRPMSQCLAANDVVGVAGILNGTSNYILTKMFRDGESFADALAQAQKLGYAERDPSADVDGGDACRKICILSSLAYGKHVYPKQVHTEGIRRITSADVAYAQACGCVVKLIGETHALPDGRVHCIVCPMLVNHESQLANVEDVFNGILVRGDVTGDVVFYGKGAGKMPTASAVVADVIDCIKHLQSRKYLYWSDGSPDYVADYREASYAFYVRAHVEPDSMLSADEACSAAGRVFPGVRRLQRAQPGLGEFAFLTDPVDGFTFAQGVQRLQTTGLRIDNVIRVGTF